MARFDHDHPTLVDDRCDSCNAPLESAADFCPSCGARTPRAAAAESPPRDDRLRSRLEEAARPEYEIDRELGRGGMGSVFLARDPALERRVAIKVLAAHLLADEQMLARFQNEAKIVAALRHPGIVSIHKFRHSGDLHFFVMDYIEGMTLREVLRAHGPLPIEVVRAVLYDVGSAIYYAHGRGGIVHRDLKPSNIMLDSGGFALVTDFGISRAVTSRAGLTQSGVIIGTPEYMSPEQCRGGRATPASDQYALGLVGYAMLAGKPPFSGQHFRVLSDHTSNEPRLLHDVRPDCPPELSAAIHRMLAKSPGDRWPDVREAIRAMGARSHEEGEPVRLEIARLVGAAGRVDPMTAVVSIGVSGLPDHIEPGETISLEVTPVDGLGRVLSGRSIEITSTEPRVAAVAADRSVTALTEGTAQLIIRCEKLESEVNVVVRASAADTLDILAPNQSLRPGETVQLVAVPLGRRRQRLEGRVVEWSSSDERILSVSAEGVVRAHAAGAAKVIARCDRLAVAVDLRVLPTPVVGLRIVDPPDKLHVGDHVTLSALPLGPSSQPVSDRKVTWTSSSTGIVRVSPTGEVVGMAPGAGRLVASCEGQRAEVTITVVPSRVERVWLTVPSERIEAGKRVVAELTVMDARAALLTDRRAEWVSTRPDVVAVSQNGELRALQPGHAEIRVAVEGRTASVEIEVVAAAAPTEPAPTARVPGPREPIRPSGVAAKASASAPPVSRPTDAGRSRRALVAVAVAGIVVLVGGFLWNRRSAAAAPTPAAESEVNATLPVQELPGSQPTPDPGVPATANATPSTPAPTTSSTPTAPAAPRVERITVHRSGEGQPVALPVALIVGQSITLDARPADAAGNELAANIRWVSTDSRVVSVTPAGVITGRGAGSATLSAQAGSVTSLIPVAVSAPQPGTIQLIVLPFADVYVDGALRASGQRSVELSLEPGTHRLRLENASMAPIDTTVVVRAGQTMSVQVRLQPRR